MLSVFVWSICADAALALPDDRAWEMVSPVEKNGGAIALPAQAGPGSTRAAAQGGAIAFASAASFGQAAGAAPYSQYLAGRGEGGWGTLNITPAQLSGAYEGDPYVAFSTDLARSLYLNPARCPGGDPCPPGYQLRDNATGALLASPADPGLFAGASADLRQIVFADGTGLYRWSPPSAALTLVNSAPVQALAAREGAVSEDGSRVYWQGEDGNLYLRQNAATLQVDDVQGGGGDFEAASADGAVAFFTKAGHLYHYSAPTDTATDLTPAGGVSVVLGASADGGRVYYLSAGKLFRWQVGTATQIAIGANLSDALAATSEVTDDGTRLFVTTDNKLVLADTNNDADVYQWEGQGTGSCTKGAGCLELISSGRAEGGARFVGASADGGDAFFVTDGSLVGSDPGAFDLYDARVGGGFPPPLEPILCQGDSCAALPPEPVDPALSSLAAGPGNPAVRYRKYRRPGRKPCRRAARRGKGKGIAQRRACATRKGKGGKKAKRGGKR